MLDSFSLVRESPCMNYLNFRKRKLPYKTYNNQQELSRDKLSFFFLTFIDERFGDFGEMRCQCLRNLMLPRQQNFGGHFF